MNPSSQECSLLSPQLEGVQEELGLGPTEIWWFLKGMQSFHLKCTLPYY